MIFETIQRLLAGLLNCDPAALKPDTAFSDLTGAGEETLPALLTALEREFPVKFSDADRRSVRTLRELTVLIFERM